FLVIILVFIIYFICFVVVFILAFLFVLIVILIFVVIFIIILGVNVEIILLILFFFEVIIFFRPRSEQNFAVRMFNGSPDSVLEGCDPEDIVFRVNVRFDGHAQFLPGLCRVWMH